MFYLLSFVSFILLIVLAVYYYRYEIADRLPRSLQEHLPASLRDYTLLPTTFADQTRLGFSSSNFDLEGNLAGDSRTGLDERQLAEIREIMRRHRVNFDEARVIRHKMHMARNGIDPATGLPLDAKAVTRL